MSILTGFPPSNTIGPGVRIAEQDFTFQPASASFHQAGLVGFASKGPINFPTLVSNLNQLATIFGYPHPDSSDPYMVYAAQAYLQVATQCYMVRVGQQDNVNYEQAATASVDIPAAGGQVQIVSNVAGPYVFDVDSFFRWRLNGNLSVKTLVILAGSYSVDELVAALNEQLDTTLDGIEFYASDTFIALQTTFAFGPTSSFEFVSVQDSAYGGDPVGMSGTNVTGFGQGMTQASVTGTNDRYPFAYHSAGDYDFSGITSLDLQIVIDGTDNVLIDNTVQVIDLSALEGGDYTATEVVAAINNSRVENGGTLPGGWTATVVGGTNVAFSTDSFGADARLRLKAEGTGNTIFGFSDFTYIGDSPIGTTGDVDVYNDGIVDGTVNLSGDLTFTITADSPGQDGNATQVVISSNIAEGTFGIAIYNNGAQVETWGGLTKDQNSQFYVESYIALVSDWIRVQDITTNAAPPLDGQYDLIGGSDGIPSDPDIQDELLIGNITGYTGLYALSDPEQIEIDLIAIPGHSSTAIVMAIIDFCQTFRQDCLGIIDPPFGLTVREIVAWQNGAHPLNSTRFDSDFAALYWPWVKIFDTFNRINIWAPPSGSVMATIARSDILSSPWFAPAGMTRGIVPGITDVFSRPTSPERDSMQGNMNAVNPIIQFVDVDGFLIWGQKTLQRRPTALDRVNVRRMLFYAEKKIRSAARALLFEPDDEVLQASFVRIATGILQDMQRGRAMYDFQVTCDDSINTPDTIGRNELWAQIGIQPTYAAEFIFIEFSLFRKGSF